MQVFKPISLEQKIATLIQEIYTQINERINEYPTYREKVGKIGELPNNKFPSRVPSGFDNYFHFLI